MTTAARQARRPATALDRTTFATARASELFTSNGLTSQTGHRGWAFGSMCFKELADNGIDACEAAGSAPSLRVSSRKCAVTVIDNGPGLPIATVRQGLDCSRTVSDKAKYISPCRGSQGHGLQSTWAIPYVLSDCSEGRVDVSTRGRGYEIVVRFDKIKQQPQISLTNARQPFVKTGTGVRVHWPKSSTWAIEDGDHDFLQIGANYAFLNPHLTLAVETDDQKHQWRATNPAWSKWRPSDPTSAHWYTAQDLSNLIAAYIHHGQKAGRVKKVREFLTEFDGLSATAKQSAITDAISLSRADLSAFASGGELDMDLVGQLLDAMKAEARVVEPNKLGVIGREHMQARLGEMGWAHAFKYDRETGTTDAGLPYVVEVAFAYSGEWSERRIFAGANWSACVGGIPFVYLRSDSRSITVDELLTEQRCGSDQPVALVIHLATPRIQWSDRGKTSANLDGQVADDLAKAILKCTASWSRVRRADERHADKEERTRARMERATKLTFKAAAWQVIPEAYRKASTDFKYRGIPARQVWYKARPLLLKLGIDEGLLKDVRFTQHFLPDFIKANPELTKEWDVVYDARGKLTEPHTGRAVPLGTLHVRSYMAKTNSFAAGWLSRPTLPELRPTGCETHGPQHRFGALLFIEKEGFEELFASIKLAQRYDIAILSTKGLTTTAARQLVDNLTGYANSVLKHNLPLFVLHDFDKSGMSILGTFTRQSRRYAYEHSLKVIDLGLRLDDVEAMGLLSEPVEVKGKDPEANLRVNGASDDEIKFLLCGERHAKSVSGQRVELNEMDAGQFVTWVERKLVAHGVSKVNPSAKVLDRAYRQLAAEHEMQRVVERSKASVIKFANKARVPKGLRKRVAALLAADPSMSWDAAVAKIVTSPE
jgi:DNA topoisomerase VI subunit B